MFWYDHVQDAAPTQELLNLLTECARDEAVLDYLDESKRNMRHRLGKPNVQALILSWLKKNVKMPSLLCCRGILNSPIRLGHAKHLLRTLSPLSRPL